MLLPAVFRIKPPFRLWKTLWITRPSRASQVACRPPLTGVLLRGYQTKGGFDHEDKKKLVRIHPERDTKGRLCPGGYRCALCDDTHGLQIHHIVHRSCGGNDTPCNLITLCWRCHAEAHGTWVAERHAVRPPRTAEERYAAYRMLQDEYEQQCVEYVSDYYAERGKECGPINRAPTSAA